MNNFIARIPLVRLLFPIVIGIIVAYSFRIQIGILFFLGITVFLTALIFLQSKFLNHSLKWIGFDGVILSVIFFMIGIELTSISLKQNENGPLSHCENVEAMNFRLLGDPVVKEKSVKLFVDLLEWKNDKGWTSGHEKMIVYLARDEKAEKLKYGDELLIHGSPSLVEGPKNPEEFDYRAWLELQGIHGQVYSKSGEWKLVNTGNGNWFKACALNLRRYFLEKLQTYELSTPAFGVSAALLLGAADHLDPGTIQSYSASGTLHVLSVSGMHVALVYVVLLKLLAPMERRRRGGKWTSILIQLVFLWFYATLTGLCPSVLRSVTMLSVVVAGRAFNKNAHILNSLSASALILLLFNPLLLFDIGFQLSYLAVGGIVLLQPWLEKFWEPRTWITKHLWTLISVTIVAQVFTFPLGLYYFKQFPTYFLLSNLFVIPLSTIVMYAGLVLLIFSPFSVISKPIAVLFGFLVELLNTTVAGVEHLPFALLHSAKWEKVEMVILYLLIISLLLFLFKKNKGWLQTGLVSFLLLLVFIAYGKNKFLTKQELVIFNVKHSTAIGIINGNENIFFADSSLLKRKGDIDFHINPYWKSNGILDEQIISIEDSLYPNTTFMHGGYFRMMTLKNKITIVGKDFLRNTNEESCDILLMHGNTNEKLDSLISTMNPSLVVADGSDSKWKIKKWKEVCERRKIPFYNIQDQGALVLDKK